jgi:hypothetical protein
MTIYLVISLPKYRVYTVNIWFWLTLRVFDKNPAKKVVAE